jgi:hypothetical protein
MIKRVLFLAFVGILALQASYAIVEATPSGSTPVAGHPTTKPKPRFPDSTMLCGIRANDKYCDVIGKLGRKYKKTSRAFEDAGSPNSENRSAAVITYNDPVYDAHLVIDLGYDSFVNISKGTVQGISLVKGRTSEKYFADRPFADKGDYYGISLNADARTVRSFYPTAVKGKSGEPGIEILVADLVKDSCWMDFSLRKGKVVRIELDYP